MSLLTRDELRMLSGQKGEFCVSIYLPTHRLGAEATQGRIRLKNLLRQAREKLIAGGMRNRESEEFLQPAARLIDNPPFWQYQNEGLALFLTEGSIQTYRLPLPFEELVVTAKRYHLKPLLPLLVNDGQFYILALSQNKIRLFDCTRYSVTEVELEGVPQNLDEALRLDEPRKPLQYRTSGSASGGQRSSVHGHEAEDGKTLLFQFFRQVDQGLKRLFHEDRPPLVLAGVDYLLPIYREANTCALVIEKGITGNPDELKPEELQANAWELVTPLFGRQREEALDRYRRLAGSGRTATDVQAVVEAAFQGRVELLFVGVGIQCWGRFDAVSGQADLHGDASAPDAEDLLDWAAMLTLQNGGVVFADPPGDVPDGMPLCAVYRY
jgi:hypothetical protein